MNINVCFAKESSRMEGDRLPAVIAPDAYAIWEWVEKNIKYVEDSRAGFDSMKKNLSA